jgi:2-iminobutanoate/2-iminopropanoate deaminase
VTAREAIKTGAAPAAIGPYSQGITCDGWIFTSGQLPASPGGNVIVDDFAAATRRALENVRAILEAAGSSVEEIVKVTIFLTDMSAFDVVNEAYAAFFVGTPPARSCIEVAALPKGAPIEIEAIARRSAP